MSFVDELHWQHKLRLARIEAGAYQPIVEPTAEPTKTMQDYYPCMWFFNVVRYATKPPEPLTIRLIQRMAAWHYDVSLADLLSDRRTADIVRPRQVAMYLAKMLTPRSLPEIGRQFGGRDHTTVLHGVRKITQLLPSNVQLRADVAAIRAAVAAA